MSCFPWKASIAFGLIFWLTALAMAQQDYSLLSPDKRIEIKIHAADRLKYDLFFKGKALLQDSQLSINIDHVELGLNPKVASARESSSDRVLEPPVRQKFAKIRDHYNQLRLEMAGGLTVVFRAYNEGAAYLQSLPQQWRWHFYR